MTFTRALCATILIAFIAACASEARIPVTGKIGGQTAFGYAIVRFHGDSEFTVDTAEGVRCGGTYDAHDQSQVIRVNASCADGRTGELLIQRKPGLIGGTATGTLIDGTRGQFVFGKDVRYEEEFPGPDLTAPPSPLAKGKQKVK
jgi:hypothetical protein